jgi:basic amino acid/polyamine antiporter, APA family
MPSTESNRSGLVRALGLVAAASIIVCNLIGQGIFLKTRPMTCDVGTPELVIGVWIAAGLLSLCGALTFAELSAMMPESGGPYAWLRAAYGPLAAFSYGWMIFFVGAPSAIAALGAGSAIFFNGLSGGALDNIGVHFSILGAPVTIRGVQIFAVLMIAVVSGINCLPVRFNGLLATTLTVLKVSLIGGLVIASFAIGHGNWGHFGMSGLAGSCSDIAASARGGAGGFAAAMIGALLGYNGWAVVTYISAEIKEPGRTIPRAIASSVVIVIALYTLVNAAYFFVLSPQAIASIAPTSSVGVELVRALFGPSFAGLAAAIVFASVTATLHVVTLGYARITNAFASDGIFFPWLGRTSTWSRVPVRAVVVQGALGAVLALLGSFDALSNFFIFNLWVFYAITATTIFVFRRRIPNEHRPYKVLGYPVVPAVLVAVAAWILITATITTPVQSLIGVSIVAVALPAYWLRSRSIVLAALRRRSGQTES